MRRKKLDKKQWTTEDNEKKPFSPLKEYESLIGEQRHQTSTWRLVAIISQISNIVGLILLIWAFSLPKTEPIFVSVNDLGEAKYLGSSSKTNYSSTKITDVMIESQLRKFITNMLTIPQDAEVLRNNIKDCYASLTSTSASKLSKILRDDNPFDSFGLKNQTVAIEAVLVISANSYQIDFFVTSTQLDGSGQSIKRKRAIMTTKLLEPSQDDMLLNPLGIYITNFDVTEIGDMQ